METLGVATLADLPRLVELVCALLAREAESQPDPAKAERGLRMILQTPAVGTIYVARIGEEVIGMVSLLSTISTAEGGPVCWLEDMIVRREYRGAGVGSRLFRFALDDAAARGVTRVTLLTDGDNESAQRLYSRCGFRPSRMLAMRRHF